MLLARLLLAGLALPPVAPHGPAARAPFGRSAARAPVTAAGEWFHYRILLGPAEAGRARLAVAEPVRKGGRRLLPLRGVAEPSSPLLGLARLGGEIVSWLDLEARMPRLATFERNDGGWGRMRVEASQDRPGQLALETTRAGRSRKGARAAPVAVYDPISALMLLRGEPLAEGEAREVWLFDGLRLLRAAVRGGPVEEVALPVGAMRGQRFDGTLYRGGRAHPFRLWLSADAARLPLRLDAATRWGRAEVALSGYGREAAPPKPRGRSAR